MYQQYSACQTFKSSAGPDFAVADTGPSLAPPLPSKKAWKYNSILTYISVWTFSFLFSFKNFVSVTVKNRVRVSSRVRVRVRVTIRV